ncbi:anthranilate synthase family protein [Asanoa iriomotensis]|uniref:anthranilate synthase n=1 Tax=Asanoa iriomotensis TaxID=234613 RepID=A0ABQ4CE04_9ACTN|nr:anthranilate synthase family protein [Asanoa iriomotensis]GIF60995.1 phenazine-specific anthranilate synthase component I [Asanoa iriomotensis]
MQLDQHSPFALVRREGADHVDVYTGPVRTVATLAEIPVPALAVVPYRQVVERGFEAVDDGVPLECLSIETHRRVPLAEVLAALPDAPVRTVGEAGFDVGDDEYAATVSQVLSDEIGRGEGANFVIHRAFTAQVDGPPVAAALAAYRRLLLDERGAYWTFVVHTGARAIVGASPERHVSVEDGLVMMNPISGTHRTGSGVDLLEFLADPKEVEELYMVLDEELKMMATVAETGGQVVGPYLKEMAHLTHTEYLLAGRCTRDVRDVLRETMFAPTVTGSPIENACRVIARHEGRGRRYYGGVVALLGHDADGRQTLDAPILIRSAEITASGSLRVPVGATLVRHSTTAGEVAETHAKAAGILSALGLVPARPPADRPVSRAADAEVLSLLSARNDHLARFWLDERPEPDALVVPALAGRRVVVVDAEDTFTGMLAHQLRALGLRVSVVPWTAPAWGDADLVIAGPGPGDPGDLASPKMAAMRSVVTARLVDGRPLLGVCLGHQILSSLLGLGMHRRRAPYQGVQKVVDLFGEPRRVGFYSTFTPTATSSVLSSPYGPVELARADDDSVHALRGPAFAGVQFHPESVLSEDGLAALTDLLLHALVPVVSA